MEISAKISDFLRLASGCTETPRNKSKRAGRVAFELRDGGKLIDKVTRKKADVIETRPYKKIP